jgi:hypothetical protein
VEIAMPMIWESSTDGFVNAMNAAFDAAYTNPQID